MATSAFKSTTRRASIGGGGEHSVRRSRSLSRFSRAEMDDYHRNAARGKFVNTARGSTTEISLDDLAIEFFSNEGESLDGDGKGREIGRWASDTASSRRRGRSVSRTREAVKAKNVVVSSDVNPRRRRSLSVATRYQISDSESEVDHSRKLNNRATAKAPVIQKPLAQKTTTTSNRRMGRSRSHKDLPLLHDGYSSQSSALTDEESKDTHFGNNGFEKIIRAVYAQKAEHPTEEVANGGLYEAMRKELRHAVQEIRTELNQSMGRSQSASANGDCLRSENSEDHQDISGIREKYATKLEQLEKHKKDLLNEMLLEEQRGQVVSTMVKELPNSRASAVAEKKPSKARKRSSDRSRMSENLIEDAEKYIEDFICSLEDTDISSFDGERSDGSSTFGGKMKERNFTIREAETYKTRAGITSHPVEMDGVILPWLQWETIDDDYLSGTNKAHTPVTPKALRMDSEKDTILLNDPSSHSISSRGSWSPGLFDSPLVEKRDICKTTKCNNDRISSHFDMDEYLNLRNSEELLFEVYRERNRINSGGMLLCSGGFY